MASSHRFNPYNKKPYDLREPHPLIKRLTGTIFRFRLEDEGFAYTVTAAEIAECIKVNERIRSGRKPNNLPFSFQNVADTWNKHPNSKNRQFATWNWETDTPIVAGNPITFADFGIQPAHCGSGIRSDTIDHNPERRSFVNNILWENTEKTKQLEAALHAAEAANDALRTSKAKKPQDANKPKPAPSTIASSTTSSKDQRFDESDSTMLDEMESLLGPETPKTSSK